MSIFKPRSSRRLQRTTALLATPVLALGMVVASAVPAQAAEATVGSSTLVPIQVTGDPQE